MRILNVILIFVFLLMLYLLYVYFTSARPLTGTHPANVNITIDASKTEQTNDVSNCTYSIWFYVSDWNYRYGETKTIIPVRDIKPDRICAIAYIVRLLGFRSVNCYIGIGRMRASKRTRRCKIHIQKIKHQ